MEQTINFDIVSGIKAMVNDFGVLDDAYLVAHFDEHTAMRPMPGAMRVDGMTVILIMRGRADLEINMERFTAEGPAVCVVHPSSHLYISTDAVAPTEAYLLYMSQRFLQSININMSAFHLPSIVEHPSPVVGLSDDEAALIQLYMGLMMRNCSDKTSAQLALNVGSSLVSALIYEMAKVQYRRINASHASSGEHARTTRIGYVHDFIKLVRAHYAQERSVAFYASKLYISPKYLSLVVKEATGRSAARWIDEYVLVEAKNMLRYSGKNIQQVAYALNFSNQSSFGKYFKHLTGMSPTEYQKS